MEKYICRKAIIKRGWTEALIDKFLPTCDKLEENPHHKNAAPMQLFLQDRVIMKEKNSDFLDEYMKLYNRRIKAYCKKYQTS